MSRGWVTREVPHRTIYFNGQAGFAVNGFIYVGISHKVQGLACRIPYKPAKSLYFKNSSLFLFAA